MDIPKFFHELIFMINDVPGWVMEYSERHIATRTKKDIIRIFVMSELNKKFTHSVAYSL